MKLSEDMEPFVSQLTDNFTGQILLSALRLPDSNAGKLYLLIREWISLGYKKFRVISVEQLKEKLSVQGKYEEFKHFKSKLLDKAIKTLIANTEFEDVQVEIVERRQKFAHMLKITYKAKTSHLKTI